MPQAPAANTTTLAANTTTLAANTTTLAANTTALPEKKQVFYFDGEDMIKRDAMVQLNFDIGDKENAEYPFPHVHTEDHENVDPITRFPVEIIQGYSQKPSSLVQFDIGDKENAEYPFPHVHTEDHENVDPITRFPVEII